MLTKPPFNWVAFLFNNIIDFYIFLLNIFYMINFEGVINPLSFGYITVGISKELFKRKKDFNFFPIGGNIDWSSFDKIDKNYQNYVNNSAKNAIKSFNINDISLRIWHINQSWNKLSKNKNYLLTFHELDCITDHEVNVLNSFDKVFVTSRFSKSVFEDYGVKVPVVYVPMGIDNDVFYNLNRPRPFQDIIVTSIFGKFEKRKRSVQVIQAWLSKYANNFQHKLHLYVTNPFFKPEQMNQIYAQIFNNGPKPFNVEIFPYLPTSSHLNDAYNATDIVVDMSGGESISLGSLNCVAMGKHAVIHNNTGMKDWATEENAVLVKPNGKEPCYDGAFFHPDSPWNQGNIYTFDTNDFLSAFEIAVSRFKSNPINTNGLSLNGSHSFEKGVNILLDEINQ